MSAQRVVQIAAILLSFCVAPGLFANDEDPFEEIMRLGSEYVVEPTPSPEPNIPIFVHSNTPKQTAPSPSRTSQETPDFMTILGKKAYEGKTLRGAPLFTSPKSSAHRLRRMQRDTPVWVGEVSPDRQFLLVYYKADEKTLKKGWISSSDVLFGETPVRDSPLIKTFSVSHAHLPVPREVTPKGCNIHRDLHWRPQNEYGDFYTATQRLVTYKGVPDDASQADTPCPTTETIEPGTHFFVTNTVGNWRLVQFKNDQKAIVSRWVLQDYLTHYGHTLVAKVRAQNQKRWMPALDNGIGESRTKPGIDTGDGCNTKPNHRGFVEPYLRIAPYDIPVYTGTIKSTKHVTCSQIHVIKRGERYVHSADTGYHWQRISAITPSGDWVTGWTERPRESAAKILYPVPPGDYDMWRLAVTDSLPNLGTKVSREGMKFQPVYQIARLRRHFEYVPVGTVATLHAKWKEAWLISMNVPKYGIVYHWENEHEFLAEQEWKQNVAAKKDSLSGLTGLLIIGWMIYTTVMLVSRPGRHIIDLFGYYVFKEKAGWKFGILALSTLFLWITVSRMAEGVLWSDGVDTEDSTGLFLTLSVPAILISPFILYISWIWLKMLFTPMRAAMDAETILSEGPQSQTAERILASDDTTYWGAKADRKHTEAVAAVFKARNEAYKARIELAEQEHRRKIREQNT